MTGHHSWSKLEGSAELRAQRRCQCRFCGAHRIVVPWGGRSRHRYHYRTAEGLWSPELPRCQDPLPFLPFRTSKTDPD